MHSDADFGRSNVPVDPTESDPDEVRAGVLNGRGEASFVFFLPGAERGAERADNLNIGTELAEGGGEFVETRYAPPEKIMAAGGGRMTRTTCRMR